MCIVHTVQYCELLIVFEVCDIAGDAGEYRSGAKQ